MIVFQDNKAVVDGFNEYLQRWEQSGWKSGRGARKLACIDLWRTVLQLKQQRATTLVVHVSSHGKQGPVPGNDLADEICTDLLRRRPLRTHLVHRKYHHEDPHIRKILGAGPKVREVCPVPDTPEQGRLAREVVAAVQAFGGQRRVPVHFAVAELVNIPTPKSDGDPSRDRTLNILCPMAKAILGVVLHHWQPLRDPDHYAYASGMGVRDPVGVQSVQVARNDRMGVSIASVGHGLRKCFDRTSGFCKGVVCLRSNLSVQHWAGPPQGTRRWGIRRTPPRGGAANRRNSSSRITNFATPDFGES